MYVYIYIYTLCICTVWRCHYTAAYMYSVSSFYRYYYYYYVYRMWPHRSAHGMRARSGPCWVTIAGSWFRPGAGTEDHPVWGPGADKSRFCSPGDRLPGRPRRWRVLLHDGICPSALSIALSGVPARELLLLSLLLMYYHY